MDYYKLKVKEKFIRPLRDGIKRHEYRLATTDRKRIKIGDVLIMTSNQDNSDYVKVVVRSISFCESWEEAISKCWNNELCHIYSTKQEALDDCSRFYTRDDVRLNGIIVFEVELFKKELRGANVLLDTNIIIHRESSDNIAYEVIQLYRNLEKLKARKCVLEDIKEEIRRHKDKNVVSNMISKIEAYSSIQPREINDPIFLNVVNRYSKDVNGVIDNKYLYLAYKGIVDFLITDDKGILLKAKELQIEDCVFSTSAFLKIIADKYPDLIDYKVLSVKLEEISTIDINDTFFDTLREDYNGIEFNKWLEGKSRNGESAYIFRNKEGLQGFLYLKLEDENESYEDIEPTFAPKKRLKVGTFKINSTGLRVGERFLKIIFDYAMKSSVEEVYVTMFENKRDEVKTLISLMKKWGFEKHGYKKSNGELVMVKKMKIYRKDKDPKFNYPNINPNALYGILPIDAQFHTDLFPDLFLKNEDMSLFEEKPCGYAVEKTYVCSAKSIPLKPGDVLAIYRMSEKFYKTYNSVVSGICILQSISYGKPFDEYKKECKNRTVFSEEQLIKFYNEKGFTTIIKVLYLKPLNKKIILSDLYQHSIISEEKGPRLKTTITKDKFYELLKIGGVN